MTNILVNISEEINCYASIVISTIINTLHIATTLGKILCSLCFFIFKSLLSCCSYLCNGMAVVLEAVVLFVTDTRSTFFELTNMLSRLLQSVMEMLYSICVLSHLCLTGIYRAFYSGVASIGPLTAAIFVSFKQLIILIGNGTLFLCQLVPLTFHSAVNSFFCLVSCICEAVHSLILEVFRSSVRVSESLHQELTEIPISSLFGLLLAAVMTVLLRFILKSINVSNGWVQVKNWVVEQFNHVWRTRLRPNDNLNESGSSLDSIPVSAAGSSSRRPTEAVSNSSLLKQLEREREEKLCVICTDRVKNVILLPCRHFCLCNDCVSTLAYNREVACPICRRKVYEHLRIYG